ncbi:hypothetical protein [Pseudomonas sp. NA-150]|uniref:hypothetical protein n=1 Tax=Pseudomonas sp. NA-150 TaxID=3367525 RepID=UPI0037CAE585
MRHTCFLQAVLWVCCVFSINVAQANGKMAFTGYVTNNTKNEVHLWDPNWDVGDRDWEAFTIPAGEVGAFNVPLDAKGGVVDFIIRSPTQACYFTTGHAIKKTVKGPMTLIGPHHWTKTQSLGRTEAVCKAEVTNYVRLKEFEAHYYME